jgi:hypothetical protein
MSKKRGRPSDKARQELIADNVLALVFVEQDRARREKQKLKGQRRLPKAFIKTICAQIARRHGVTTKTVATYFYRHHKGWRERWSASLEMKLSESLRADALEMQIERKRKHDKLVKSIK